VRLLGVRVAGLHGDGDEAPARSGEVGDGEPQLALPV
jgi:hypothetical protein